MAQALARVQDLTGGLNNVHFINGGMFTYSLANLGFLLMYCTETGWPGDGGTNAGPAIAGTSNEEGYYKSAVCGMLDWGVDLFWFEAFDEPNKPNAIGEDGKIASEKYWGAMTADRTPKFDLTC